MPDLGVLKNVMAHNWVEPSKRERKRVLNYSEADYYKQVREGRRRGWVCGCFLCICGWVIVVVVGCHGGG